MIGKLLFSICGIYTCYLSYGIFQEKIFKFRDANGERFTSTLFLLCVQCFGNAAIALIAMLFSSSKKIPSSPFSITAATYLGAMLCSNEALKHVSYPTQALGKSCKMIPVMIMGVFISGKKYSMKEYICVLMITLGITVFQLGKSNVSGKSERENSTYGLFLLFMSLTLDGITGPKQDQINHRYKPSVHQQMFYTNAYAFGYTLIGCLLTNHGSVGLSYCMNNPSILPSFAAFALLSALGQNFIFYTIQSFSALTCTTITTTRKFFTILFSVLWFGHPVSMQSWMGVIIVFIALSVELSSKYMKYQTKKEKKHE